MIFTGKEPNSVFQVMFGKGTYSMPPMQARLFGLVLASAAPLVFGASFLLGLLAPDNAEMAATAFEIIYDLLIAVVAIIIARRIRKPAAPPQPTANPPS